MRPFFPSIPFFPHHPVVVVALFGTVFVAFDSARGEVLCDGLPDGGRLFCHVACCIRQQGNRQSYYCCGGNDDGTLPSELYREGGRQPLVYRADQRPDRYSSSSVTYSTIDWWNTLLISLAVSIVLSVVLSLLCCLLCARRRRN